MHNFLNGCKLLLYVTQKLEKSIKVAFESNDQFLIRLID